MRATWLLVLVACCSVVEAAESTEATQEFENGVKPFLRMYCAECHTGDEPEAELLLEFKDIPNLAEDFDQWTVILQKVGGHEMPPEDVPQPSDDERARFVKWVDAGLAEFDCTKQKTKPRATVRRLNRFEYNNVIHDLLGIDVSPADEFPADNVGEGFDNIGEVLSLPPLLMEKYLDAAEAVTTVLGKDKVAWQRLFPSTAHDKVDASDLRADVGLLASKAFRRPLRDGELDRLFELYELARERGSAIESALAFTTQAILISPQFLFRLEEDPLADSEKPKLLDGYAIASRLSFFLWSTIPDAELDELASSGELEKPEVVAAQARRMLVHPKASALVESFAGQWLELRLLEKAAPDPDLFPNFNDVLRKSMVEETSRYFRELILNDGSILELIDSDYTFLNDELAAHYGIEDVDGSEFQRVQLPDDRRGGVLTQASILTLTSNPTRTSPVKRGKWILENILGTPPPPPPPNVPELEEGDELLGSLRERMQQHRENPSCSVCHRKMDALGFGFENFDAIGGWRDRDGRYEIDASGELPGGVSFQKPAELREILQANSREFTGCLTRKLLTYALGRALSSRDLCAVDDIVKYVESRDHRFSELVVGIVTSDAFRYSGDKGANE